MYDMISEAGFSTGRIPMDARGQHLPKQPSLLSVTLAQGEDDDGDTNGAMSNSVIDGCFILAWSILVSTQRSLPASEG